MKRRRSYLLSLLCLISLLALASLQISGCGAGLAPDVLTESDATPAADSIGEALFLDTRFSQYFEANMTGVNSPLTTGDPVVAQVETTDGTLPGPFAGQSINCRSCHFVTEFQSVSGAGNRTYADFAAHSPMPRQQPNGFTHSPRNAMQMVGSLTSRSGPVFLHFDGEFTSGEDLVTATMTGRNFGWFPTQKSEAIAHIARVIRQDDGTGQLAADRLNGLSYAVIFKGTDPRIPSDLRLGSSERLDVSTATDDQIVSEIAHCMTVYMKDLLFQRDKYNRYIGSPYDNFLRVNHLPVEPKSGESKAAYSQRLLKEINALSNPIYITPTNGTFKYHDQDFKFGALELQGLKIFLTAASTSSAPHAGNCVSCHAAPDFSDFVFHNSGVTQAEYDAANGSGAFLQMSIPSQSERIANFNAYMPVSGAHPNATENLRHPAQSGHLEYADLGLWNIYQNPDVPKPQSAIQSILCTEGIDCSVDSGLPLAIARFKTPVLRDLADSAPYFHNGSASTLEQVVQHYINMSTLAKSGKMRNTPAEFTHMNLSADDLNALVAFLKSLSEDYDDS